RARAKAAGTVTFQIEELGGHQLPVVPEGTRITGISQALEYDPRTGIVRLADTRAAPGLTYGIEIPTAPTGVEMAKAPAPPAGMSDFLQAPPVPLQVQQLLAGAPNDGFDRLQAVRQALYSHVVAFGPGEPRDVSATRVVAMLSGAKANPYEIAAGEALLARWAGLPSRIAYGWFGGDKQPDGWVAYHPVH